MGFPNHGVIYEGFDRYLRWGEGAKLPIVENGGGAGGGAPRMKVTSYKQSRD